jgi:hypothetical protein
MNYRFNEIKPKIVQTILLTIITITFSYGQSEISSEKFRYIFKSIKNGGEIIYNGKNHYFSINVIGKKIRQADVENSNNESNQNFVIIDNVTVQTSIVPLPQTLPKSYNLSKLSSIQKKELLDGYVNYELDYFKNELNLNLDNVKKEWKIINSNLFIFWYFEMPISKNSELNTKRQIYVSTICFNQVLVINVPIFKETTIQKYLPLVTKLAESVKMLNQAYSIKK